MDENKQKEQPVHSDPSKNIPNTPVSAPVQEEPSFTSGPEPENDASSSVSIKLIFLVFLGFISLLLIVFYVLLIVALQTGDVSNQLFVSLGIEDRDLQSTLFLITHSVFGTLVVVFLFSFLIHFFQFLTSSKEDIRRPKYIKQTGITFLILVILSSIWIGLYVLIRDARVQTIGTSETIISDPVDLTGLSAPVKVRFNIGDNLYRQIDESQVKQINWDFDQDGKTDRNGAEVFYTFRNKGSNDGKYLVKATVIYNQINNPKDIVFETTREVIIANESISAEIYASEESGPAPLTVKFSGEGSVDPDGEVVFYEWDFDNDGVYEVRGADKGVVEHRFPKLGNYPVKLRVQGANNDFDSAETMIEVTNPERNLRARITSSQSKEGYAPYTIQLSGEQSFSSRGRILKYVWFIDGKEEVVVSRTLRWTFSTPGQYLVRLLVENDLEEKDEEEILITVKPPLKNSNVVITTDPAMSSGNAPLKGEAPFEVEFSSIESQVEDAVEWRWDFDGDGEFDVFQQNASYIFREEKEYVVGLSIIDIDGDEFYQSIPIEVVSPGVKAFIDADPIAGEVPLTVYFDGSGSFVDNGEIIGYEWKFPAQEPFLDQAKIAYEFPLVGRYKVELTVITDQNETDTTSRWVVVRAKPIRAEFEAFPLVGAAPLTVDFDATNSMGNIVEYRWDFGDGIISRQQRPSHTYSSPGVYNAILRVVDAVGVISEYNREIQVR